jgi:8-oxo-dGTP pyrophosphatase MutT (NUDIX family)
MAQMYKVFFNDRIVFLTDQISEAKIDHQNLVYPYKNTRTFKDILNHFSTNPDILSLTFTHHDVEELFSIFSSQFLFIEAAGGVVKNNHSEILVIFRYNKWDLPKGKIDKKESPEKAAIREIHEECGITGHKVVRSLTETFHTYTEKHKPILKKTYWFEFFYDGKEELKPQAKESILKALWSKPKELNFLFESTYESIKEVLKKAGIHDNL